MYVIGVPAGHASSLLIVSLSPCWPQHDVQVGFCPLGPVVLALRMVPTLLWLGPDEDINWVLRLITFAATWLLLGPLQVVLGYSLKRLSALYMHYRSQQSGGKAHTRAIVHKESGAQGKGFQRSKLE